MSQKTLPEGWDEGRVRRVLAPYEAQTQDEEVAEDKALFANHPKRSVPRDLMPKVREIIAKRRR